MEMKLIRENGTNDPAVGYNVLPQWRPRVTMQLWLQPDAVTTDLSAGR